MTSLCPKSEARLAGERGQLEFMDPAGLVLGVQIVEGISDRNVVYQQFRALLATGRGPRAR